ncbi:RNA 2',3'-cyclic phosphodiesterase [Pelotalea chapellei]|uniref:RNA 2',3'-cyclic phosphodiesterase n=1 Tax=Pelotalea chapellei TaxID=44671 RepID=A0ABS5U7F4_9BACT|nr:RNA 2',3'-cyclic phosphodiesterase [Pelotalea chapellei]MBT1071584.1 RNA 2',3'-cyclic phosphodiesterase [Pelotalea chapellei]
MPRLFIAIDFSDEIKYRFEHLRVDIPGAKWVFNKQIHLTLAFLGDVENALVPRLTESLDKIHSPPFQLQHAGTGCFPDPKRPRVLWAGFEPQPLLNRLVAKIRTAVMTYGIPQDSRAMVPHVTLARIKAPAVCELNTFLHQSKAALPPVEVHEFILFESRLTSGGAVHSVVQTFKLDS